MNLYSKHTIKRLAKGAFVSISVITLIISSMIFLNELYLNKIAKILDAFLAIKFFLLSLIPITVYVTPISACCATLYIYHTMETDRELVIWESVGLNKYDIAKPAISFAVFITTILLCFTMFIVPMTEKHIKTSIDQLKSTSSINSVLEERSFNKISINTTLYADKVLDDGSLEGVIVYTKEKDGNNSITVAERAETNLNDRTTSFYLYNGNRHSKYRGLNQTIFFKTLIVNTPPDKVGANLHSQHSLDYLTGYELFKLQKPAGFRALAARTVWPLTTLVLIFISSSILLSSTFTRQSNVRAMVCSFAFPIIIAVVLVIIRKKVFSDLFYTIPLYTIIALCILVPMNILKGNINYPHTPEKLKKTRK